VVSIYSQSVSGHRVIQLISMLIKTKFSFELPSVFAVHELQVSPKTLRIIYGGSLAPYLDSWDHIIDDWSRYGCCHSYCSLLFLEQTAHGIYKVPFLLQFVDCWNQSPISNLTDPIHSLTVYVAMQSIPVLWPGEPYMPLFYKSRPYNISLVLSAWQLSSWWVQTWSMSTLFRSSQKMPV
jgi:hypothetical protein